MIERWDQIGTLFGDALDRAPDARTAFLDEACRDPTVRAEVEALLEAYTSAPAFVAGLSERVVGPALGSLGETPEGWAIGETVSHYRIDGLAGRGGMGVVYRAWDTRLERPVALKVLPAHLSADDGARRRLVREARAAALDHPHIASVYEIGETASGQVFLAMAYVEGGTLRERLEGGPVSVPEAVALARQIAEGLRAAHRQGVVHRDVKPSNVLVTPEGAVRLVDFGIATAAGATVTRDTSTRGTVAYMSPEQTRGEEVGARSDVWSFGVLLYEMLAGRRPFRGDADATVIHAIRHDPPVPVDRPDVPAALRAVVARCLEKDPADRYADMDDVLADLRAVGEGRPTRGRRSRGAIGLGVAALVLAVSAGVAALWPRASPSAPVADEAVVRLAVLPLDDLSADSADAYLADALTEELIGRLSALHGLRVTARSSVVRYRGTEKGAAEVAGELGVEALLDGSVQADGERVLVDVRLVGDDGRPLWSALYDAEAAEMVDVQTQIAEAAADALGVEPDADERRRLEGERTTDAVAYDHYLKGRYLLHSWDAVSIEAARDHFQQAIDRDPTFAGAWAGLADIHVVLGYLGVLTPKEMKTRGQAAARRALDLDPDLAEAHNALASVLADNPREWEAAERHFRRAIALDPSYALARQYYAEFLRDQARFDEALAQVDRAQTLDPLSPYAQLMEGIILWFAGRSDDALSVFQRILDVHGEYRAAHLFAGLVQTSRGEPVLALSAVERADPGRSMPDALSVRAWALAMMGRRAEAEAVLAEMEALSSRRYVAPYLFAVVYAELGDTDRAFDLLHQTIDEEAWFVRIFKTGPVPKAIREDPRFPALLERAGLGE